MNVVVIGSRNFTDYNLLEKYLNRVKNKISLIISGGARGADSLAERFAINNNIPTKIFYPDWGKHGKSAGILRNKTIIDNSDIIIAFWDGLSRGTFHSINLAKNQNKPVKIIKYE